MRNRRLINAINRVEDINNRLSAAIQSTEALLVYEGFDDIEEPELSMASGDELILVWRGHEIQSNIVLDIMERNGCITPQDFDVLWGFNND
jgi:hypothetical protein